MKIALITPNYPPETGACASRMQYLAQALQKKGHLVEVHTFLPNYPRGRVFLKYRRKIWCSELVHDVSVWRYPIIPSASSSIFYRAIGMFSMSIFILFAFFRLRKTKPDILFVQSPPLLLGLSGWCLAKLVGAKFVLNLSDLWPRALVDLNALQFSFPRKVLEKLEHFLYLQAALCVGQSEEIIKHLQEIIPYEKSVLYRTGTDCRLFFQTSIQNTQNQRPYRLIYAGLLGIAQGIFDLCQNLKLQDINTELHIYGDGAEYKKLEKYLTKNKNTNIYLNRAVPHTEIPYILQKYDAVLVVQKTKVYGTFPSKIYEAMAVGRPIIQSGAGEGAETVRKFQVGLISPPKDYEMLHANIMSLKELPINEQQRLGDNGRQAAVRFFDREMMFIVLEKRLCALLSQ